jgi:uncharacterized oxidoreductase
MMDLHGHRVFITGGTRGIGFELAKALSARGIGVALCGRSEDRLAAIRKELPDVTALACDLADIDGLPTLIEELRAAFGSPTILVNNAGVQFNHQWLDLSGQDVVEQLRVEITVNLTSPLALTALLLEDLVRSPTAALVNLSSLLALKPKRSAPVYCATKAAVHSFTQSIRYQLDQHPHVRVVEVIPPLVDTGMTTGRGSGKISPAEAAAAIVAGLERDANEIYIGKAKVLRTLLRISPRLVGRILRAS